MIGEKSWVGIGTSINNNLRISPNVVVGSGSNVVSNLERQGLYYGNPAKFKESV